MLTVQIIALEACKAHTGCLLCGSLVTRWRDKAQLSGVAAHGAL